MEFQNWCSKNQAKIDGAGLFSYLLQPNRMHFRPGEEFHGERGQTLKPREKYLHLNSEVTLTEISTHSTWSVEHWFIKFVKDLIPQIDFVRNMDRSNLDSRSIFPNLPAKSMTKLELPCHFPKPTSWTVFILQQLGSAPRKNREAKLLVLKKLGSHRLGSAKLERPKVSDTIRIRCFFARVLNHVHCTYVNWSRISNLGCCMNYL